MAKSRQLGPCGPVFPDESPDRLTWAGADGDGSEARAKGHAVEAQLLDGFLTAFFRFWLQFHELLAVLLGPEFEAMEVTMILLVLNR